jgi:hypothetical protein
MAMAAMSVEGLSYLESGIPALNLGWEGMSMLAIVVAKRWRDDEAKDHTIRS